METLNEKLGRVHIYDYEIHHSPYRVAMKTPKMLPGLTESVLESLRENSIEEGNNYIYTGDYPKHAHNQLYRFHRLVLDVPTYQWKLLCEALTGNDKGLWFSCTINNFVHRYQKAPQEKQGYPI